MATSFVFVVPRFEMTAVVSGKEDNGIIIQIEALKCVSHASQSFIEAFNHAVIAAEMLMRRAAECGQIWRNPAACIGFAITIWWGIVV